MGHNLLETSEKVYLNYKARGILTHAPFLWTFSHGHNKSCYRSCLVTKRNYHSLSYEDKTEIWEKILANLLVNQ